MGVNAAIGELLLLLCDVLQEQSVGKPVIVSMVLQYSHTVCFAIPFERLLGANGVL